MVKPKDSALFFMAIAFLFSNYPNICFPMSLSFL